MQRHKLTFTVFVSFILVYLFEARTYYLKKNSLKGEKKSKKKLFRRCLSDILFKGFHFEVNYFVEIYI